MPELDMEPVAIEEEGIIEEEGHDIEEVVGIDIMDVCIGMPPLLAFGPTCYTSSISHLTCSRDAINQRTLSLIYLDNRWPGDNIVVCCLLVSLGQDNVALAHDALGNSHGELAISLGLQWGPDRTGHRDEGGM